MNQRDAAHHRGMLAQNLTASIGLSLAAEAVYATRYERC